MKNLTLGVKQATIKLCTYNVYPFSFLDYLHKGINVYFSLMQGFCPNFRSLSVLSDL